MAVLLGLWALLCPSFGVAATWEKHLQLGRECYQMRRFHDAINHLTQVRKLKPDCAEAYLFLARIFREGGKHEDALKNFYRAWQLDRRHSDARDFIVDAHRKLAARLETRENWQGALDELSIPIDRGIFSYPLCLHLYRLCVKTNRWDLILTTDKGLEAERVQGRARPSSSQLSEARYFVALAQVRMGRIGEAFKTLKQAVEIDPDNKAARALLARVVERKTQMVRPYLTRADTFYKQEQWVDAAREYAEALKVDPEHEQAGRRVQEIKDLLAARAHLRDAELAEGAGKLREALENLQLAASRVPGRLPLLKRIQAMEERLRQREEAFERAQEQKEEARRQQLRVIEKLITDGQQDMREGRFEKAIHSFRRALELAPERLALKELVTRAQKDAEVQERWRRARQEFLGRRYPEAVKEFAWLQQRNGDDAEVLRYLALCHAKMDQYEEAERQAKRALDKDPPRHKKVELYYLLGEINFSQKEVGRKFVNEAYRWYGKAAEEDPSYQDVQARIEELFWSKYSLNFLILGIAVATILLGWIIVKKRPQWEQSAFYRGLEKKLKNEDWEGIVQVHPNVKGMTFERKERIFVHLTFARALLERGQVNKAITDVQKVLALSPDFREGRLLLARCFFALRKISPESLPYYYDLIDEEPDNRDLLAFVGQFCVDRKIINPNTLELLRTLAAQTPEDDRLRRLLVKGYLKDGDRTPRAMNLFKVEAARNPDALDVRAAIAEEAMRFKRYDEAIKECEEILNRNLLHRPTHDILLKVYEKLGKLDELARTYQSILENDPHNRLIQGCLQRILHPEGVADSGAALTNPMASAGFNAAIADQLPPPETLAGGTLTDPGLICPRCGAPVVPGTYFCSCGEAL